MLHLFADIWNNDQDHFQNVDFDMIIDFLNKYRNALQYESFKENRLCFLKWLSGALDNGAKAAHSWVTP